MSAKIHTSYNNDDKPKDFDDIFSQPLKLAHNLLVSATGGVTSPVYYK